MSEAAELLAHLRARGLSLVAVGDRLDVSPTGELTDADRAAIRANKPALLSLLGVGMSLPPRHENADPAYQPAVACARCSGHLELDVCHELGRERGVHVELWPVDEDAEVRS